MYIGVPIRGQLNQTWHMTKRIAQIIKSYFTDAMTKG